jgi:hypothetical protein
MGRRSTKLTNVTSNESWDIIGVPSILGVGDYHHDRGTAELLQASSLASYLHMIALMPLYVVAAPGECVCRPTPLALDRA